MDADPTRWLDSSEQATWRAFLDMHAHIMVRLNRELMDECGVSVADYSVLVPLSEHADGRLRVLELARGLGWEKSRLSHQLSRMQQRGLISRSNCSEDRRGAYVALTAAGREVVQQAARSHVESVRRYVFDPLSGDQVRALGNAAGAVVARLRSECAHRESDGVDDGVLDDEDGCPGQLGN